MYRTVRSSNVLLALLAGAGCLEPSPAPGSPIDDIGASRPIGQMATRSTAELTRSTAAPSPLATTTGAHLRYFGGKMVQHAHVMQVLYGSGTYIPQLTATAGVTMAGAYTQMVTSGVFDWLKEYNTNAPGQTVGRGSFGGSITIAPAAAHNGSQIFDASIQAELTAQFSAGTLPQPTDDTIYMLHFPAGKSIKDPSGAVSCVPGDFGGFCGYHWTFKLGSQNVYYAVLPDLTGGCATGCGTGTTFQNQQVVASHELVETMTDAEAGLLAPDSAPAAPLAWFAPQVNPDTGDVYAEIGDICRGDVGTYTGNDGVSYTIQKEFSNQQNACILTRATTITPNPDSDILWRDTDGTLAIWFIDDGVNEWQGYPGKPGNDWVIRGVGDFDGDGKADILWRNVDGTLAIWFMNGAVNTSQGYPGKPGNDWKIRGVGDFDHDGKADILWRNDDGTVAIWLMNGAVNTAQGYPGRPGNDWVIQGVGDFDHDGRADILWRDSDGTVAIWFMNGPAIAWQGFPGQPGNDWVIQGVGDFDHDGKSDLLWRNLDGTVAIWFMDGGTNVWQSYPGKPGNDWVIQGVGSFD